MQNSYVDVISLKKYCVDKGLEKKKDLAMATGLSRYSITKILNGKELPSSNAIYALVKTLSIPAEEIGSIFFNRNLHIA